ncbi:hypothetical protein [Mangrovibacterium sp.]|uniref:hypothetical protein n=1 Tax=Mangrovibacterium sp. TaxID=1961364 RepID=UPI003566D4F3
MTSKTNAEKAKGQNLPVMEVKKTEATKATDPQQITVEELQKRVDELTAKLKAVPTDLNSRIEYFNEKKELIRKLTRLQASAENLQTHLDTLAEIAAKNEFETEDFVLSIEGGNKYNRKQVFALQNPILIGEVLTYLLAKVEAKADELKKLIEA